MKRIPAAILLLGLVCANARTLLAYPAPPPGSQNLRALTAASDLVCRGSVIATGPLQAGYLQARIAVSRVYKGQPSGNEIIVRYTTPEGTPWLSTGDRRLFFLKSSGVGYTFADPWFGQMTVPAELDEAAVASNPLELMEADFKAALRSRNPDHVLLAVERLGQLKQLTSTREIKSLLPTADDHLRGNIYLALERVGEYSMLNDAGSFVCRTQSASKLRDLDFNIAWELRFISSVIAVPQLEHLTSSCAVEVRQGAIYALRHIAASSSVPVLVRALRDADKEVRYNAVMGLAQIEGKTAEWGPSTDEFDKNEAKYISFWQHWWESEGHDRPVGPIVD